MVLRGIRVPKNNKKPLGEAFLKNSYFCIFNQIAGSIKVV